MGKRAAPPEARLARFGRKMAENNLRQAYILNGAEILENPNGTAPGQWFRRESRIVMLLPGPPREIQPMFVNLCVPRLRELLPPMFIATPPALLGSPFHDVSYQGPRRVTYVS